MPHPRMTDRRSILLGVAGALSAPWRTARADQPVGPVMERLSRYMAAAASTPLPAPALEQAKLHILDTLGAMVSGATLRPGKLAIAFARGYGGEKVATVVASDVVVGPIEAALANGILAPSDETDDSHAPSLSHPGAPIVAATLAAGERFGIDGARFVRAVALGYDIGTRMTMTLGTDFPAGHKSARMRSPAASARQRRRPVAWVLANSRCAGCWITPRSSRLESRRGSATATTSRKPLCSRAWRRETV